MYEECAILYDREKLLIMSAFNCIVEAYIEYLNKIWKRKSRENEKAGRAETG